MSKTINKIAVGTAQFGMNYGISNKGGITPLDEVSKIIHYCQQIGINVLDTAHAYGKSEEALGAHDLSSFHVISKFPKLSDENLTAFLKESCDRLNLKCLYGYLAHSAAVLLNTPRLWDKLKELKEIGKVEKIGYSVYKTAELESFLEKGMVPDIIQVPFSLLDTRFDQYFSDLKKLGTEIHVRSTFLQGLLFVDPDDLDEFFNDLKPILKNFNDCFPTINEKVSFLLNYSVKNKKIDKVILGINTLDQLKLNIKQLENSSNVEFLIEEEISEEILLPYNWPKN